MIQKKDRVFDFQQDKLIQYFEKDIMNGTITLNNENEEQILLKLTTDNFSSSTRPTYQNKKDEKDLTLMIVD